MIRNCQATWMPNSSTDEHLIKSSYNKIPWGFHHECRMDPASRVAETMPRHKQCKTAS